MFYGTVNRELIAYYEAKSEEVKKEVDRYVHEQQFVGDDFSMSQQTWQVEHEKVQHSLLYEREVTMKLEASFGRSSSPHARRIRLSSAQRNWRRS